MTAPVISVDPDAAGASRQPLRGLIAILRRWPILLAATLVGAAVGIVSLLSANDEYVAKAQVFVTTAQVRDASGLFSGNQFVEARVQSYIRVVNSPQIVQQVKEALGLGESTGTLAGQISASAPLNETVVTISVRNDDAQSAARIANAVADEFITYVKSIETVISSSDSGSTPQSVIKLTTTQPARAPQSTDAPDPLPVLLISVLSGLAVGLLICLLIYRLDNRLISPLDIDEITSAPLVGVVPADRDTRRRPLALIDRPDHARAEAYRLLRANLILTPGRQRPSVITVSSPLGGEGCTTVAVNLALALAETGASVCLVDADPRSSRVARMFDVNGAGLVDVLSGDPSVVKALRTRLGVAVVPSGGPVEQPSSVLNAEGLRPVIEALSEHFGFVVIDALPLLRYAGALEVASLADVSVLVVGARSTHKEEARRALEQLVHSGSTATVVFNGATSDSWLRRGWVDERVPSRLPSLDEADTIWTPADGSRLPKVRELETKAEDLRSRS